MATSPVDLDADRNSNPFSMIELGAKQRLGGPIYAARSVNFYNFCLGSGNKGGGSGASGGSGEELERRR